MRAPAHTNGWFGGYNKTLVLLCVFIFFFNFKPSEPHLTRYLRSRGFTSQEINNDIYPWSSYSYLPLLVLGGLLAEIASYRSVILLGASARIGTRLLLLFGTTVRQQQLMQILYSFGSAAEVLFFAFVYVIAPSSQYGRVTAAVQGTYWAVHVLGAGTGDMLLHLAGMSLETLVILSSAGIGLSVLWGAFFLPSEAPLPQSPREHSGQQHLLHGEQQIDFSRQRQYSAWSGYADAALPVSPSHAGQARSPGGVDGRPGFHRHTSSEHNSPRTRPTHSSSHSVTPWELEQGSINSAAWPVQPRPCSCSAHLCCARAWSLALCRTAWVEVCCSRQQLYGSTALEASHASSMCTRLSWVLAVLRSVYSSSNYLPLALWWTLTGDPPFQNVRNYESSLYDELLPSASTDYNGSVIAATLTLGSLMAYLYAWPRLSAALQGSLPWNLCVFSILCGACLVLASLSKRLTDSGHGAATVALLSQMVFFGLFSLANALYYDVTGKCVQTAAAAVAAEARWAGRELSNPDHEGDFGMTPGPAVPPFFIVFVLNSCASVAVQSISTFFVFQWASSSVLFGFFVFGCMAAAGVLGPVLAAAAARLGCAKAIKTNPEAQYRPTHIHEYESSP